jgi:PPOX class probable FMN-dependent enzyme
MDRIDLDGIYGEPGPVARAKQIDRLDKHCRHFISLSPFLCLGSAAADGRTDVSPRGDPPGFVKVLDDETLAIPDRPGNNRIDSFKNIVQTGRVGLIFFVPGIEETLRINGTATFSRDQALLRSMAVDGKLPRLAVIVHVDEAFLHCARALKRSKLWDAARHVPKGTLPSLGRMIIEQTGRTDVSVEEADARIEKTYRENLY